MPTLPAESRIGGRRQSLQPARGVVPLLAGIVGLPIEAKASVGQAAACPFDSLGGISTLFGLPVEAAAGVKAKPSLPSNSSAGVA